jgi:hypothetical protein
MHYRRLRYRLPTVMKISPFRQLGINPSIDDIAQSLRSLGKLQVFLPAFQFWCGCLDFKISKFQDFKIP